MVNPEYRCTVRESTDRIAPRLRSALIGPLLVILITGLAMTETKAGTVSQIYPLIEDEDDILICDDLDEDGILDALDNCAGYFNPEQSDQNHNGIGDACE